MLRLEFRPRLLVALLGIAIAFSSTRPIQAQDASGVWRGRWRANATATRRAHGGTLNAILRPIAPGEYRAIFYGRFAVVVPYVYTSRVYQCSSHLVATRRIGWRKTYTMRLNLSGNYMQGTWSTTSASGTIALRRTR